MERRIRAIFAALLLVITYFTLSGDGLAAAQGPGNNPAIIQFGGDLPAITLEAAEAGQTTLILSWQVAGMSAAHRLRLDAYVLNRWESLIEQDVVPLPAVGARAIPVQHPLNFGAPTYRLSVVDGDARVLDERTFILPYDTAAPAGPPAISFFATAAQQVGADALASGTASIQVSWQVANRPLLSNLIFDQVLPDGRAVSVELPRPNLWVPSSGEGPTRPVLPPGDGEVRLRLRLVDMVSGSVYDERELSIPISSTPLPPAPPTAAPLPSATPQSQARILSFSVTPGTVDRGGTVTLSWQVQNAASVTVWRLQPGGPVAEFIENQPQSGTWTLALKEYYVDSASFQLWATDANGVSVSASATVKVRCPYTYFFGQPQPPDSCPLSEARDVPAVIQSFERGTMIWRSDTREIYILYAGGRLGRFQDTWTEGEVVDTGQPPAGLIAPARGFGKAWITYTGARDDLGWATGPEQPYTMRVQSSGAFKYARLYLTLPDGRVIYLVESTWRFVGG